MTKEKEQSEKHQVSIFKIWGGYKIPLGKDKYINSRTLPDAFWESHKDLKEIKSKHGVYVFYRQAGNHRVPFYVGKTNAQKGFEKEVFDDDKITKYNNVFHPVKHEYAVNGNYYLLFYVLTKNTAHLTKYNKEDIRSLEKDLIRQCYIKNPYTQNVNDTRSSIQKWRIDDLTGKGRDSKEAKVHQAIFS